MKATRENAETLALSCLEWLVGNDELLPVFLGATGTSENDLRARARDPEFLGAVLDFVMMDDAWVMAFCEARDLSFEAPMQARAALPGGGDMNWT